MSTEAGGPGALAAEPNWLVTLLERVGRLLQVGLQVHEELESTRHQCVVRELCEALELDPDRVPIGSVATTLFALALFGQPELCPSQRALQELLLERLDDPGDRLLLRQLRADVVRAWSCAPHAGSRLLARAIAGPARREEPFDALVDLCSGSLPGTADALGWLVPVGSQRALLAASVLSPEARAAVERVIPLPMPRAELAYWTEQHPQVLRAVIDPLVAYRAKANGPDPTCFIDRVPIFLSGSVDPAVVLERVVLGIDFDGLGQSFSSLVLRRVRNVRTTIAQARRASEVDPIIDLLRLARFSMTGWRGSVGFTGPDDSRLEQMLPLERMLDAFSLRADGSVLGADPLSLASLPASLLLLDDAHPLFRELHPVSPIRAALDAAERAAGMLDDVRSAFERLVDERRWQQSFAGFSRESEHLEKLDLATLLLGLQQVFDPRVLDAPVSVLGLSPRLLGRLESALGSMHRGLTEPRLRHLPDTQMRFATLHNIGPTTLVEVKRGLLHWSERWRAESAGVDARVFETSREAATKPTELIASGLDALAQLFAPKR